MRSDGYYSEPLRAWMERTLPPRQKQEDGNSIATVEFLKPFCFMSHVEIPFVSQQPFLFVNNLLLDWLKPFYNCIFTILPTLLHQGSNLQFERVKDVSRWICRSDDWGCPRFYDQNPLLIGLADAILESLEKMQLNNGFRNFAILRPGLVSVSPDSPGRYSRTMHHVAGAEPTIGLRAAWSPLP